MILQKKKLIKPKNATCHSQKLQTLHQTIMMTKEKKLTNNCTWVSEFENKEVTQEITVPKTDDTATEKNESVAQTVSESNDTTFKTKKEKRSS